MAPVNEAGGVILRREREREADGARREGRSMGCEAENEELNRDGKLEDRQEGRNLEV